MNLNKSVFKLVENAKININCVKTEDTIKIHSNKRNMFVDGRDIIEITKYGRILGSKYVPRVILEFWIDTKSHYQKKFLNEKIKTALEEDKLDFINIVWIVGKNNYESLKHLQKENWNDC